MGRPKKRKKRTPPQMGAWDDPPEEEEGFEPRPGPSHPEGVSPLSPEDLLSLAPPVATDDPGGSFTAVAWSDLEPMTGFWSTGDSERQALDNAFRLAHRFLNEYPMDPERRQAIKGRMEAKAWSGRLGPFQGFFGKLLSKLSTKRDWKETSEIRERVEESFEPEFRAQQEAPGASRFFDVATIFDTIASFRSRIPEMKDPPGPASTIGFILEDISPPTADLNEIARNIANYFGISQNDLESIPREERLDYMAGVVEEAVGSLNQEKPEDFPGVFQASYLNDGKLVLEYVEGGRYPF